MNSSLHQLAEALSALPAAERSRLDELAALAGCSVEEIWPAVYRYGFADIEDSVRADKDAQAEHSAGRTISHEEVMADVQRMLGSHGHRQKRQAG